MENLLAKYAPANEPEVKTWFKAGPCSSFPPNAGACVKYQDKQIAVFHFTNTNQWYACQNLCPHRMEMVISRGLIGDEKGEPKVACPMHKRTFSLISGENLNGDCQALAVYPVKIMDGYVYIGF
jgi:nitrite reductase (NADH) small subunit